MCKVGRGLITAGQGQSQGQSQELKEGLLPFNQLSIPMRCNRPLYRREVQEVQESPRKPGYR